MCVNVVSCKHLPINAATQGPVTINEEVHSCKQQHHGHWIIKESQHKDGVDAIRSAAHKKEHVRRNLGKSKIIAEKKENKWKDTGVLGRQIISSNVIQIDKM